MSDASGYRHQRGLHCGSSALRNTFAARGLALSEPLVFGLGAGLGFSLCDGARGLVPPLPERLFLGRSLRYEEDLCEVIGARLEVLRFDSPDAAWSEARALIDRGAPPLTFVDLFHLPYLGARGHWLGHLIALAGMSDRLHPNDDPAEVLVGDNERDTLQPIPLETLKLALTDASPAPGPDRVLLSIVGVHPLSPNQLRTACSRAISLQGQRLRESPPPSRVWRSAPLIPALAALRALPAELASWKSASDPIRRLRFAAQVIEVRGNGGGLFHRLYAAFLEEAAALGVPEAAPLLPLCLAAAAAFTALARELDHLRQSLPPTPLHPNDLDLSRATALAEKVFIAEQTFADSLA